MEELRDPKEDTHPHTYTVPDTINHVFHINRCKIFSQIRTNTQSGTVRKFYHGRML